ncbi:hypothetical protein TGRUB_260325 [Toxoplasma gondii RUB]|uniref:Uncharacterized protein n=4 Tax=Toxoplasma gondii TaxID=5811 RepID=S7UYN0_TOXGG|nr:hypothetical protein TGGT1_260325 [Toxoplasma gondii GT1]KAF4641191.1 hypothetical protein TGRH88_070010 [Toxoplasma gondii]KFG65302.1 hypothetical protein TGRUB_260325 [Toxoplasma gondii RUB]KFH10742.1 hypothetical protein TGVAND_260325 [Toxoplasma gondii VAND]
MPRGILLDFFDCCCRRTRRFSLERVRSLLQEEAFLLDRPRLVSPLEIYRVASSPSPNSPQSGDRDASDERAEDRLRFSVEAPFSSCARDNEGTVSAPRTTSALEEALRSHFASEEKRVRRRGSSLFLSSRVEDANALSQDDDAGEKELSSESITSHAETPERATSERDGLNTPTTAASPFQSTQAGPCLSHAAPSFSLPALQDFPACAEASRLGRREVRVDDAHREGHPLSGALEEL